ncbi:MAG: glutamine synthetase, partial [Planktomarina temperata]|nr:glutamine synthetase [Planktomarina temperata]
MSWKDSLPASAKAYIGERQLDEVECIISDFPGVARGKAVPASKFARQKHFYLPNSIFLQTLTGEWAEAAGEEGWVEPDMTLRPDLDTATAAPWATDATLQVSHDAYDRDGAPIATAPRNVLKRVVQLFRDKGLEPVVAPEMEFFLV